MKKKWICATLAIFTLLPAVILSFSANNQAETVPLPVIMYHHISKDPKRLGDYIISPETFQGDMEYLRSHGYTTISIQQLLSYTKGETSLPEKPILITFDDGQSSFGAYALPILKEYHMCAVLAIVGRSADEYTENGDHNINYCYFTWPELAEMSSSGYVELASHTYDLHSLKTRQGCKIKKGESLTEYAAIFNQDLQLNETRFLSYLGEKPIAFAYPYGIHCKEAKQILCNRGYCVLFNCNERVNQLTGDPEELLSLCRFNRPNSMNREQFFQKLIPQETAVSTVSKWISLPRF